MPGMNGLECAEQISHLSPRPAIIFVRHMINTHSAFKFQAQGYLLKPIAQQDLQQVFNSLTQLTQTQMTGFTTTRRYVRY